MRRTSSLVAAAVGIVAIVVGIVLPASRGEFTWISGVWALTGPGPFLAAGVFLLWRRPGHRVGEILTEVATLLFALSFGLEPVVRYTGLSEGLLWVPVWLVLVAGLAGVVRLTQLCALIPDGRYPTPGLSQRLRWLWLTLLVAPAILVTNEFVYHRPIEFEGVEALSPFFVPALGGLGPTAATAFELQGVAIVWGIWSLRQRYRTAPDRDRRQIRWVLYGLGMTVLFGAGTYGVLAVGFGSLTHGPVLAVLSLPMAATPLAIAAAVMEPDWLEKDAIARKSLAYSGLSFLTIVAWAGLASALGLAADARLGGDVAVVAAVAVAIAFQPVRRRLQAAADRSVFGDRPSPAEALAGLGERSGDEPSDLLSQLAQAVRAALRLHWVRVVASGQAFSAGTIELPPDLTAPMRHGEDVIGVIECGRKVTGSWAEEDAQLVRTMASQAALAIANARLATRIATAQETERRRIERNIHDGAQQELVALIAQLGLARGRAEGSELDPAVFTELQEEARRILSDLRELAQGIHPSVLSDGGLLEAIEDRCGRLPIDVRVTSDDGLRDRRFPDDVEGAAYFFVTECLANVLKHAGAKRATVTLAARDHTLHLSVGDDGVGFTPTPGSDRGLAGLRDRLAALGGSLEVSSRPGAGSTITAFLPVDL